MVLGEIFSEVFVKGSLGDITIFLIILAGGIIGGTALVYKALNFVKMNLGDTSYANATKADLVEQEQNILDDLARAIKKIERVESKIDNLALREVELRQLMTPLTKDIERLSADNDSRYLQMNVQIQDLQKELASLHGTLLGLGADRQGLK